MFEMTGSRLEHGEPSERAALSFWGGSLRFVLVLFSHRVLCSTPFLTLSCQKTEDGDVLMHACQKITAQLFGARSQVSVAGETGTYTHFAGEVRSEGVMRSRKDQG